MKKIISTILCLAMTLTLFAVPAMAESSIGQPYILYEDFDADTAETLVFEDAELISDGSGGQYIKSLAARANTTVSYPSDGRYVIEFDTMFGDAETGNSSNVQVFVYDIGLSDYAETSHDFSIFPTADYAQKGIDLSKWYTVRISIDESKGVKYNSGYGRIYGDAFTVEWKERGTDTWRSARNSHGSYDYSGTDLCYCVGRNFWQYVSSDLDNEGIGFVTGALVDNVKVYVPGAYATRLGFESGGKEMTTISSDSVSGVATLENARDAEETVLAIVQAFNSRGEVVASTNYESWTVPANSTGEYRTSALYVGNLIDVASVKLSLSKAGADGEVSLGEKTIYPKPIIVDDSTDGYVRWNGYDWAAVCVREDVYEDMIYDTKPCPHGWIYVDDNDYMNFRLEADGETSGRHHRIEIERDGESEENQVNLNDNFDFEFDMRVFDYGEALGYQHYGSDYRVYIVFTAGNIIYQTPEGTFTKSIAVGYDWNTFRTEKRGMHCSLYMNGDLLVSFELPKLTTTNTKDGAIRFYGTPYKKVAPNFQLRRMELNEYEDTVDMIPDYNQKFAEGSDIEFKANMTDSPDRVDYYVGDVKIGSATAETDYSYILKDAQRGSYKVSAKVYYADGSEKYAFEHNISVGTDVSLPITCPETLNYGETATLSVDNSQGLEITSVDYYVDGVRKDSSLDEDFSFEVNDLKVGTASVYGIAYLSDGSYVTSEMGYINVNASGDAGDVTIGQEYDLSYDFGGGSGEISLKDGHFEFNMSHSASGVTYQTRDGEETYAAPNGRYRAIVTSGVADVYRDGQLAFSYFMPRCTDEASLTYSGISNVALGGSGVKAEVFRREINGERDVNAENINMGLYYSIEFDKEDTSGETVHLYDGEYEISVKFNGGITVLEQPRTEWEVGERQLCDTVESGYYRITVYRGLGQIFLNNEFLGSFRAPKTAHKTELRRVMSSPGATSFISIKNTEDIFYFEDDFEGDNDMPSEEYWYTFWGDAAATFENGKMNLSGVGTYTFDATAENPTFKWDMALALSETETEVETPGTGGSNCEGGNSGGTTTTVTKTGQIKINVRFRNEYQNVRIIYDHSNGTWSLVETTKTGSTTVATATKSLISDTEYPYVLDIKDDKLTFSCDGKKIFDEVELGFFGNGKFGFTTVDCNATIDNLSYVGNGKTNTGVNYAFWPTTEFGGTVEFLDLGYEQENTVGIFLLNKVVKTTDDGETWSEIEDYTGKGYAANSIILQSGRRLTVSDWGGQSHAGLMEADGTTIKSNCLLQAKDDTVADRHAMQGRLTQGKKVWGNATEPRVYYVTSEGAESNGTTRVYFSDDEGITWTESRTDMSYMALGDFYAGEADIVELPDGTVRVWLRCDRGFLYYLDSFDGGLNFELKPHASQLMTPSTAFSIERDSEDANTYYIIWTNDVTTAALQYIQQPRNRASIAVSHDGTKTWEYIMEMEDKGIYPTTAFCNASMRVIDGKVYANHGHLDDGKFKMDENTTINQITYTLDPSKFKSVKRFANAHYVVPDFSTIYDEIPKQAVLPKSTGTALIYGSSFPTRVDGDGLVEAESVARAVGARLEKTESGVNLILGDGVVTFTKGSFLYSVNGEECVANSVCLSEDGEYLNPEICVAIFGKEYSETASAHILLNATLGETERDELGSFVGGVSESLRLCIEDFKVIKSAADLKNFFTEYKIFLNLDVNFTDKSYGNMYNAYTALDLEAIVDYGTLASAIDSLTAAEKGRVGEFLDALNAASESGDYNAIETYLTETYSDLLPFTIDTSGIANPDGIYKKMIGIIYYSVDEVESVFNAAYTSQLYVESGKSNAISVSTVSGGTDGWSFLGSNDFGGVSMKNVEGDNVITLSAFEKVIDNEKIAVEASLENGLVYHNPGGFAENTVTQSGVTVDSESGTVAFDGGTGKFVLTGAENAKSSTVIYVFDMTKPTGAVKGTFDSGVTKTEITFDENGCSLGEIGETLKTSEELTYRIELSQSKVTVYAKVKDAPDTDYMLLGTGSMALHVRSKWSVSFETEDAKTEIFNIGVYSALSSIRYDVSGYELVDDIYYSVDGGKGHTFADLIETGLTEDGTIADDGSLKLIESAGATPPRGTLIYGTNNFKGGFERAELDMTVQVETGGTIFLYFLDNSGFRYSEASFSPDKFNGSTAYSDLSWKTGQYYDIKIITSPAGYDAEGQTRTSGCMYAKREEDTEWICIAQDIPITAGNVTENALQFAIMNCRNDEAVYIKEFSLKTYAKPAGSYEFVNSAANMPGVDYVFSFDYNRMDSSAPTQFTIGGEDYCQSFTIEPYRVVSNLTDYVTADIDIETDKWYRIYGKVTMTAEGTQAFDKTKIVKNTITMYLEDADGNATTLFKDLPMLKKAGNNGLRFRMSDTSDAGIRLKNVRVYNGKALDLVSTETTDGKASITVDFLNDETAFAESVTLYGGAYEVDRLIGAKVGEETALNVAPFGYERMSLDDILYTASGNEESELKLFMWQDGVPVTPPAASK